MLPWFADDGDGRKHPPCQPQFARRTEKDCLGHAGCAEPLSQIEAANNMVGDYFFIRVSFRTMVPVSPQDAAQVRMARIFG